MKDFFKKLLGQSNDAEVRRLQKIADSVLALEDKYKGLSDEELQRQEKRRKEKSAVRFVVDTSFSVLGAFQLDGFSFVKDKRFDLIVRTEKDMTRDFCSEMMRLFQKSLGDVGYSGNMKINVKEKFYKNLRR